MSADDIGRCDPRLGFDFYLNEEQRWLAQCNWLREIAYHAACIDERLERLERESKSR